MLRAKVPISTHFLAEARSLGALLIADTRPDPPAVLRSGIALSDASGKSTNGPSLPWPFATSAPRIGRVGDRWAVAWDAPVDRSTTQVMLFRGGAPQALGSGDAYTVSDLACGASRCALLTSRAARVAPSGADVVLFDPSAGAPLRTISIEPAEGAARPFGLAAVEGPRGAVAVLVDGSEVVFWATEGEGAPAPFARAPAEHGVLDATLLADRAVVMAHANVVDEQGCARDGSDAAGAKIHFVRPGLPPSEVRSPGPPSLAALRPLKRGALAVWQSPLGCGSERRVVYAVVLTPDGAAPAAPLPVGDGDTFVVSSSADDVDLWIRRVDEVSWLRLVCTAPP